MAISYQLSLSKKISRYHPCFPTEIVIRKETISQNDTMYNPLHRENTFRLVSLLQSTHPFLGSEETVEDFCTKFNCGSVAEYYRTLFNKKKIWWKNGSYFQDGWKAGLPAQLKPYFYLMGVKLNKGTEEDPCAILPTLFDCRSNSLVG